VRWLAVYFSSLCQTKNALVGPAHGGVITLRMERAQDMRRQSFEAVHEDNGDELALVPACQLTLVVLVLDVIEEPRGSRLCKPVPRASRELRVRIAKIGSTN
jgi:hypothetical protein